MSVHRVVKFLRLVATNSTETLKANQRIAVKEGDKKVHVYGFDGDIAGVAITTDAYPQSTVQALLTKICNDFTNKYPRRAYDGVDPSSLKFEELTSLITQYQHPESADPMLKLQKELADTKVVLYDSIGALSQRGETLDSLVAKSDALNYSSKMFYKNVGLRHQYLEETALLKMRRPPSRILAAS